jgi:peptidoglycan/LPS O-acetylase OafA/YrhL
MVSSVEDLDVKGELVRRHAATARTVLALLIGVVLLCIVAYLSKKMLTPRNNPSLDMAVRISILIFGLSSIALRRTKFSAMRLQDIGGLQGPVGLLATLQRTTIQVALLACVIALIGFAGTLLTSNDFYTYAASVVAIAVLLYAYTVRRAWETAVGRFASVENQPDSPAKTA